MRAMKELEELDRLAEFLPAAERQNLYTTVKKIILFFGLVLALEKRFFFPFQDDEGRMSKELDNLLEEKIAEHSAMKIV